jgi:hypothetical protein
MPPAWVTEPIDVLEYCSFCLSVGLPFLPPDQFSFQGFEEGFDHQIVIAIAFAAHALPSKACLHA